MSTEKRKKPSTVNKISNYCTKKTKTTTTSESFITPVQNPILVETTQDKSKQFESLKKPNDFFYASKDKGSYYGYETELFDFHPPIPCRNDVINSRTAQVVENKNGQW